MRQTLLQRLVLCRPGWHLRFVRQRLRGSGGDEGLLRLAEARHRRVVADEVVGHAFRHGVHPHHTARLAAYWAEALGGPARVLKALRRRDVGRADA